jgi:hypothetical protein
MEPITRATNSKFINPNCNEYSEDVDYTSEISEILIAKVFT